MLVLLLVLAIAAWPLAAAAAPPPWDWPDYEIIMRQQQTAAGYAGLRRLGVTAGAVLASRAGTEAARVGAATAPLRAAGLRWYVENIATDFYAAYHRWQPGRPVTERFLAARALHRRDPADPAAFIRDPSLSDPVWRARIADRLAATVHAHAADLPLFYSLGDETGIADLAAPWDFDFSPVSLAGFRGWLATRYGSLAALNRQWGSDFPGWDAVLPITTEAAVARTDGNFAPWADFKAWMDVAFADALRAGTDAVHRADPAARAGIEGGQVPGWGGYDYGMLARAADVMEMYDAGNNVEIVHSLAPEVTLLTTTSGGGAAERARIWHELLLGGRGLILWDDSHGFVRDDGRAGPVGDEMAKTFAELRGGIAALLIASAPRPDPLAILYSPASIRIDWLLARQAEAVPWEQRDSEAEGADTTLRAGMRRAASLAAHLGVQPRWLTPDLLAGGALDRERIRALVLPRATALSDGEIEAIRRFALAGGLVLADGTPGRFDAHGSRRPAQPLADLALARPVGLTRDLDPADPAPLADFSSVLQQAGVVPSFRLLDPRGLPAAGVTARLFGNGAVTLIGIERDSAAAPTTVTLALPLPGFVYDLRRHLVLGRTDRVALTLDADGPALLAVAPAPLPPPRLAGPATAVPGEPIVFQVGLAEPSPATAHVLRLEPRDPGGTPAPALAATLRLRGAPVSWSLTLPCGAPPGRWPVRATDVMSQQSAELALRLRPTIGACPG